VSVPALCSEIGKLDDTSDVYPLPTRIVWAGHQGAASYGSTENEAVISDHEVDPKAGFPFSVTDGTTHCPAGHLYPVIVRDIRALMPELP
jgi:hypothetical protein